MVVYSLRDGSKQTQRGSKMAAGSIFGQVRRAAIFEFGLGPPTDDRKNTWKTEKTRDYIVKWKHFPRHWPFVLGIHW